MRTLLAGTVLAAMTLFDAGHAARAQWCAYYDEFTYSCGFRTFQQCLDTISGVGGICRRDYRADEERRRNRERRSRERRYRE